MIRLDPTRPVNESSGGNFELCGDIQDVHHYPGPMMNAFEGKMINVIGEYDRAVVKVNEQRMAEINRSVIEE